MAAPASSTRNVYDQAAYYRRLLLAREQGTVDDMVRRYLIARYRIDKELDAMVRRVEKALAEGKKPVVLPLGGQFGPDEFSASWLYRVGRGDLLSATIEAELSEFTEGTLTVVAKRVNTEAATGGKDAGSLLKFRVRDDGLVVPQQFAQLPSAALAEIVSFSGQGGPHPKAFRKMGPELVAEVQQRLIDGVAAGKNPRVIAVKMQADAQHGGILDRPLYEQMRVARTEPLRAYREASRRTYQANSDVCPQWEWHAFPGPRTCPYCLAMDGTRHELDEPMATHPQCRCTELPVTELSGPPEFTGPEYLYRLSAAEQDEVFGSHTFAELYRQGAFNLGDMVQQFEHPDWGPSGRAASMASLQRLGIINEEQILAASNSNTLRPTWAYEPPTIRPLPALPRYFVGSR